jgi:hypothetical protein
LAERVVRFEVLGLPHEIVLPADKISESALEAVSFGLSLPALSVIHGGQIRHEQVSPVRAEHPVGIERQDGVENDALVEVRGLAHGRHCGRDQGRSPGRVIAGKTEPRATAVPGARCHHAYPRAG